MFTSYDWVAVAELVSKSTGKFLVGVNYESLFPTHDLSDDRFWVQFIDKGIKSLYDGKSKTFLDIIDAIINDKLICFDTEQEAMNFYTMCDTMVQQNNNNFISPFIYLVSPTEGYLTDTN